MKFLTRLAVLFYVAIISLVCGFAILFVMQQFPFEEVTYYLSLAYYDSVIGTSVLTTSGAIMLLSLIFGRIISGGKQEERTIAFDNPSGRVSVSLSAVEDLVRRLMYKVPEVKEVKPSIAASKRGVEIKVRLILKADVNIPETTSRLQDLIKNKIQEILGLDETVLVRIHIIKIISDQSKSKRQKEEEKEEKVEPTVPFQGYRS